MLPAVLVTPCSAPGHQGNTGYTRPAPLEMPSSGTAAVHRRVLSPTASGVQLSHHLVFPCGARFVSLLTRASRGGVLRASVGSRHAAFTAPPSEEGLLLRWCHPHGPFVITVPSPGACVVTGWCRVYHCPGSGRQGSTAARPRGQFTPVF